jgi:hypothetical protein
MPPQAAPTSPSILASNRSPEEVRSVLSRYRAGVDQARAGDAPLAPEATGADG